MSNSVFTTIFTDHSGEIDIKIIAEHPNDVVDFDTAQVYSIWSSDDNPLGLFTRMGDEDLFYYGSALNEDEYKQVAFFIFSYREGDWDI